MMMIIDNDGDYEDNYNNDYDDRDDSDDGEGDYDDALDLMKKSLR